MKALDLFCGAGGVSMGLHRAGFEVVGVDIRPQPRYPFTFVRADALRPPFDLAQFDFIWASPPCQAFARIGAVHGIRGNHPDLIEPTRDLLAASGVEWVMENIPDSKIPGAILCGSMFGLGARGTLDQVQRQLRRHRLFESSFLLLAPPCQHSGEPIGVYGKGGPQRASRNRGYMGGKRERIEAMGIDWMDTAELSNAIPPAYSEFIGRAFMQSSRVSA